MLFEGAAPGACVGLYEMRDFTVTSVELWPRRVMSGDRGAMFGTEPRKLAAQLDDFGVELGYAQTAHGAQGRTVDRSLTLIDGPVDARGVYVPMTRGRENNTAYIAVEPGESARDVLAAALNRDWIDRPAITMLPTPELIETHVEAAPAQLLSPDELRGLWHEQAEINSDLYLSASAVRRAEQTFTHRTQELSTAEQHLNAARAGIAAAQTRLDGLDGVWSRFHQRDTIRELRLSLIHI